MTRPIMLTQCPSCQTVFRVTPAILRAAHGQVRCGRCSLQFDAVAQLLDADEQDIDATQTALKSLHDPSPEHSTPDSGAEQHPQGGTAVPHEDIVLEGNRIEISGIYPSSALDDDPDFAHTRTIIEEIDLSGDEWQAAVPTSVAQSDASPAFDEPSDSDYTPGIEVDDVDSTLHEVDLSQALDSLADPDERVASPAFLAAVNAAAAVATGPSDAMSGNDSTSPAEARRPLIDANPWLKLRAASAEDPLFSTPPAVRHAGWIWTLASVVLVLLLCAQLVHHFRHTLARHPAYGASITRLYAMLGQPLAPQWDLNAYRLQQWGMVSDPQQPGVLRMRASVSNGGSYAQPYPLLKISLENRFGGQVGTRAFTPAEYLGNAAQAGRLLAAGESANIDLALMDPGEDAVGFQFDTCLNSSAGLRCTHSGEP